MRMRLVMLAAVLSMSVVSATNAFAQQPDCKSIQDPKARLACFDGAARAPKAAAKKAGPKPVDEFGKAKTAMLRKLTDPDSAKWGEFFSVQGDDGPMVCGMVNAKNRMGGYDGMTGFVYLPSRDESILLFSGNVDGNAGIATVQYRKHCVSDPRSDQRIRTCKILGTCP